MNPKKRAKKNAPSVKSPVLPEPAARSVLEMAVDVAKEAGASDAWAQLGGGHTAHVRFARNGITTTGDVTSGDLSLTVAVGKRTASVSTNRLDRRNVAREAAKAVAAAKLLPEDKEWMPPLGPQKYASVQAWHDETAQATAAVRAKAAGEIAEHAAAHGSVTSGFFETRGGFSAMANSAGLFAYHRATSASLSATTRTEDQTGSGWASSYSRKLSGVDVDHVAKGSTRRAVQSAKPQPIEPGDYPVILEPEAVGNLVSVLGWILDARSADEGRSYFSKNGGGNKVGDKIIDSRLSLVTDPSHPLAVARPFDGNGMPVKPMKWVSDGVLQHLNYTRYWAKKQGKEPTPSPTSLVMEGKGETTSLEEMIAGAKRAILVTRFWYIRSLDPRQVLLTGLTRDGLFLVENGKISKPLVNFRFNESPMRMLNEVDAFGKPVPTGGGRAWPALSIKKFHFSSTSEAV